MSKFEFQKLELPQQILEPNKIPTNDNSSTQRNNKNIGYYLAFMAFGMILGYFGHATIAKAPISYSNQRISPVLLPKLPPDSTNIKPKYFNYYDSIVFLNQVKGQKIVVSEGYDDYIKKNKLIVKVGGYYYNLFCDDLMRAYSVGDSIP